MDWRRRWGNLVQGAIFGAAVSGCFVDQPSGIDRICPAGANTCECREGQECNTGLTCMEDGRCRDPRCVDGKVGCKCMEGNRCETGLECLDASCLVPGGESTGDTGVVGESSNPGTSVTTVATSTTSPTTTDPTTPLTTTDDASATDTLPTGEVSGPFTTGMTSAGTDASDTMVMMGCQCGWSNDWGFFACGIDVLPYDPDPEDNIPFDCPNGTLDLYNAVAAGEIVQPACDAVAPPIDYIGCCVNGVNVWCDGVGLVFSDCAALGPGCM